MGTITGQQIVDRGRRVLQDTAAGGTRWLDAEVLDWLNDAQREIVLLKPNASSVTANMALVAGTKQSIPDGGIQLLDIIRNVNGPAITPVERVILDSENRSWHTATAAAEALHYVFDEEAPTTFYVYPPQPAVSPGSIEIVYSAAPVDMATLAATIYLNDIYANPMLDYMLYRSYSKDTEYAGNDQRAANHYGAFQNSLGLKVQAEAGTSPNNTLRAPRATF